MVRNITKMVILLLMAVCHPLANAAGTVSEKASVRAVLDQVFDAMRAGDAETLKTLILSDTALDRISPNEPVERGTSEGWIGWVSTLKPGQADEQIFDVKSMLKARLQRHGLRLQLRLMVN